MSFFKKRSKTLNETVNHVSECDTSIETEKSVSKGKKIKNVIKHRIVTNGKESAINFAIKKVIGYIFSAVLSAALVLFTQHSFKDNFKDYVKNYISVHIEEFSELVAHGDALEDMGYDEAEKYCMENNIYEKSKNLLKVAISYSSDDKDINMLHSSFKDVCEDLLDLSVMLYTASNSESVGGESDDVYDDVLALSDSIRGASANMNVTYPADGSPVSDTNTENVQNAESIEDSECHNAIMKLKAKLEIFVDLSNELCKKHKIDPFI